MVIIAGICFLCPFFFCFCIESAFSQLYPGQVGPDKERNLALRVYEKAPPGTLVATLRPQELAPGITVTDIRFSLRGNDRHFFSLTGNSLIVRYQIGRSLNDRYYLNLEVTSRAPSNYVIAIWNVTITVTKKNGFPPQFQQDVYNVEVYRYTDINTTIIQLQAKDSDEEYYNSQISYRLVTSDLSSLFAIDKDTGWIRVTASLEYANPVMSVQVVAMDTGSPPLQMTSTVNVILREVAAPENLQVTVTSLTTARICWRPPVSKQGRARLEMYTLAHSLTDATEHTITKPVLGGRRRKTCTVLENLIPRREYWVGIRAVDGGKAGVVIREIFRTEENACTNEPCGRGFVCKLVREAPGYRCARRCDRDDDDEECRPTCYNNDCKEDSQEDNRPIRCYNGGYLVKVGGEDVCHCLEGFGGRNCELHDVCEPGLCDNGATCQTIADGEYTCVCQPGYSGYACQFYDPCSMEPCKNGGLCVNITETEYECQCLVGYTGKDCSNFNPCASAPCQNKGICRNVSEFLYECDCPIGYHGYDCENYNPCFHDPCLHDGMCNSVDGEYVCDCEYGRFGKHCERLNMCEYLEPCGRHAIGCHNVSDKEYRCICHEGWSGQNCTTYDPCHDKPCLHDSRCEASTKTERSFNCVCNPPYYGSHCEKANPCLLLPCKNEGKCVNTSESSYMCTCREGYYGSDCEYFNSCLGVTCLNGGLCQNVSDTEYHCVCPSEYYGDRCQYANSCASNPCRTGKCVPSENGQTHVCLCAEGYTGFDCRQFDPCASHPCKHGGSCFNTTDPAKLCICKPGYHGNLCEKFDACLSNPCRQGTCKADDQDGYHCFCPRGMFGPTCESTDPCTGNPCQHHGTCISTHGPSFRCICPSGYYGTKCEHFNPCVSNPCHNGGVCTHPDPKLFTCKCPKDFQGKLCQYDIPCEMNGTKSCLNGGRCLQDEAGDTYCQCSSGYAGTRCEFFNACEPSVPCLNGGSCIKTARGRYECRCLPGFFGERCEFHTPCLNYICLNNGTCVQTKAGDVCRCLEGYQGVRCEYDVDECDTYVCDNGGTCKNHVGGYKCLCPAGFVGIHCENKETCPQEARYDASGAFKWEEIEHGELARLPCPRNTDKMASRSCDMYTDGRVAWSQPDTSACNTNIMGPEEALRTLAPFTNSSLALNTAHQVAIAAMILEMVLPFARVNRQVANDVIRVVDQILNVNVDLVIRSNASDQILSVLDELQSGVQLARDNITLSSNNVEIQVVKISNNDKQTGVEYKPETLRRQLGAKAEIHLPPEVFTDHLDVDRVHFSYFRNGKLFVRQHITEIGDVISASIGTEVSNLKKCVIYILENEEQLPKRCVYFDKIEKKWSSHGMLTVSNSGHIIKCCSNHLTYFATIKDASFLSPGRQFIAFLTSFSGTGISILFLFFVLLTYSLFRSLNREGFGQVVVQLALSMLLWNVSLLIGFNRDQVDNDLACLIVAVCTHYLTLSTLLWVSCTAHHVYKMLGRDYHGKDRCFCFRRVLIAWGLPMIPVAIPLGININLYQGDARRCLMSQSNRWLYCSTYLTPCCIILFINFILFILVIKASLKPKYEMKSFVIGVSQIKVRGTCVIVTIMGICWLLGYFAERERGLYFDIYIWEYAFFGTNTLLGIFVFLFYVLLRRDACAAWRNMCCRRCVSKRRRVAGKSPPGSTSMKSEGNDYHLVLHRKSSGRSNPEEDKMLERDLLYRRSRDARNRDSIRGYVDGPRPPRQYHALDTDSCPPSPSFTTPRRLQPAAHNHLHQSASSSTSSSPHPNQFHHQVQHHQQSIEMTTPRRTPVDWVPQQSRI